MEITTKYYIVTCKGGHVGRHYYLPIELPIIASSAKEAADIAKGMPRVKKNRDDVILNVNEVSYLEYQNQCNINLNDPYFKCHNIQEQRLYCYLSDRLVYDDYNDEKSYDDNKDSRNDRIKRKKRIEELRYDYVSNLSINNYLIYC